MIIKSDLSPTSPTNNQVGLVQSSSSSQAKTSNDNHSDKLSSHDSNSSPSKLDSAPRSTELELSSTTNNHTSNDQDCVNIIHFNDCYNVEPGSKSSGAAGFLTAVKQHKHLNPIILFSGDIISPSFMSTFTKGEQMIPVLNDIGVNCAVFGNHEFDYGVENLVEFAKRTRFPWLLSNVIDKETSKQLGDGQVFHIMERSGIKFGLIGLIEEEWLSTLSTLDSSDVIYEDFVQRGRELAIWLKSEPNNVDYVIALTHFRTPNDIRLADSVPEIDLILGGHDHDYDIIRRTNCYIIKSGTDFREFSKIKLKINPVYLQLKKENNTLGAEKPFLDLIVERVECLDYEPDIGLSNKLEKFFKQIDEKMGKVLGQFNCDLDGRFSSIRKFETNLGNFVTDIMLASTHADLAILNSGTLRSDRIHPRGDFTMRDLFNILGYIDPISVLEATGLHVWRALENGVSQWPKLEGRFPQISGCSFVFDPSKPPGSRIDPKDITIGDEPLLIDKKYRLTTKAYLASGKDGYDVLKDCVVLVPGDESPDLTTSILNHFEAINIVKANRRTHRQSIICLSRTSLKKILDQTSSPEPPTNDNRLQHHTPDYRNQSIGTISQPDERLGLSEINDREEHDNDDNNNIHETYEVSGNLGGSPAVTPISSSPLIDTLATTPNLRNTLGQITDNERSSVSPPPSVIQHKTRAKRLMSVYEMEHEQCKLEPKVEGRIRIIGINNEESIV